MAVQKFKLVFMGDANVGKSSLLSRFGNDVFNETAAPTVGVDFITHRLQSDGKTIRLQIWDIAGEERFRSLTDTYVQGIDGAVIVFDITNSNSFKNVRYWSEMFNNNQSANVVKLLVGNKCDLSTERVIEHSEAKELADSLNIPYIEASAKDTSNVHEIFLTMVNNMAKTTVTSLTIEPIVSHEEKIKLECDVSAASACEEYRKCKLVLLGDSCVGKSALLKRLTQDTFDGDFQPTVGIDFITHTITQNEQSIRFQIWDTAGQERYRSLSGSYCQHADGFIIIFDVTNEESFNNLTKWLSDAYANNTNNVKTIFVGNKCDLTAERVVHYDQAKALADSRNVTYLETSPKNGTNVEQVFMYFFNGLISKESSRKTSSPTIRLEPKGKSKGTTSGFC
ncbi:unnamed protein product [Adineta ricciae]|uniref:Uncharacterized protein n=2 Tax=Adineta ricciae TaxID=249248 RepID=A0A815HL74_ADIRI|nr:unnamed protein product [Adineta ricciae]